MLISRKEKLMRKKELVLLMTALTKGGKTTIATALCHPNYRCKMVSLSNCRTEVTVDWTYDSEATDIILKEILLNYQGVFGTDTKERISCEKFSEVLDSKEGKYLQDTFGLEKQENLSCSELEEYVLAKIVDYINNCDDNGLARIIKDRLSNRFLRRIRVVVPPVDEFIRFFNKKEVSLVLRDTRGLLDIDPEEATKIQNRTMQELGIDGIDAVLLLGTESEFADTAIWYKKAYKEAFESVPIFIMTRLSLFKTLYRMVIGNIDSYLTDDNISAFLQDAKMCEKEAFEEIPDAFLPSYRLLEQFEVGKINENGFVYNYKVYNNEDLRYIYPVSAELTKSNNPDYDSPDYRLYESVVFDNLKKMVSMMIEHNQFISAISNQIKQDFVAWIQKDSNVVMYPEYRKYSRVDVCENILAGSILGPRNGIVTTEHGNVKYLGAVTSGVSARIWMRKKVYLYEYSGILRNPDGSEMIHDMLKECRDNLIRMALFNIIEKNTDIHAYFQGYYFINRFHVQKAISNIRKNNVQGDALDNTSMEIATIVL